MGSGSADRERVACGPLRPCALNRGDHLLRPEFSGTGERHPCVRHYVPQRVPIPVRRFWIDRRLTLPNGIMERVPATGEPSPKVISRQSALALSRRGLSEYEARVS